MTVLTPCERCGHPADWHRHDDESTANQDGHNSHGQVWDDPEECPYRCVGYDCEDPDAWPPDDPCDCPDYQGSASYE